MNESLEQVELLDESLWPEQPALVKFAAAYQFTGTTASKDEDTWLAVMEDLILGASERAVASKYRVSRNSIGPVRRILEERGKLEPLKKRLSAKLGRAVELGVDLSIERLEAGAVASNVLPIMVGVFVDKKALIDGDVGMVIEHRHTLEPSADRLLRRIEELKRARVIDVEAIISEPPMIE